MANNPVNPIELGEREPYHVSEIKRTNAHRVRLVFVWFGNGVCSGRAGQAVQYHQMLE